MKQSRTTEKVLSPIVVRGLVLHLLAQYQEPSEKSEKEIEKVLPLLYLAEPKVRAQAAHASRLWMGTKDRCPVHYRRLLFYRLRHLDNALDQLERMTRLKKRKK
jgi:hypothetical protein